MQPKLLLFDIDGTLITGRGVPKKVFIEVVRKRFPYFQKGHEIRFSGMTDPQVVSSLLKINEHDQSDNRALVDEILDKFLVGLAQYITPEEPPTILPGVRQILEYCHANPNCYLGLVTGNMAIGAHIKLTACGLYPYFPVGAFGSDNANRHKLPPLAVRRAESYYQKTFRAENTWIIGDSINDVRCAKSNNLRSIAVASSTTTSTELKAENPDHLLDKLEDTDQIASCIFR